MYRSYKQALTGGWRKATDKTCVVLGNERDSLIVCDGQFSFSARPRLFSRCHSQADRAGVSSYLTVSRLSALPSFAVEGVKVTRGPQNISTATMFWHTWAWPDGHHMSARHVRRAEKQTTADRAEQIRTFWGLFTRVTLWCLLCVNKHLILSANNMLITKRVQQCSAHYYKIKCIYY